MRLVIFFTLFLVTKFPLAQQYDNDIYKLLKTKQAPFYFGVASGDPTSNSVLIWTKITPLDYNPKLVYWEVAIDTLFTDIQQSGEILVDSSSAYSVIANVNGLNPGTYYFYRFKFDNSYSPVGRTKTAPLQSDSLRFAVVSCNNYEAGFFNAFFDIAKRRDIEAVIHLGDYIYEYSRYSKNTNNWERNHIPAREILTLSDYRSRYAQYRLDENLKELHRLHPFITVWDDHEFANNAYVEGAQNHQIKEGDWETRKKIAKQVYFEWLPVSTANSSGIIRKLDYGNLATLFMLDERIKGRTVQLRSHTDSLYFNENRYMIGNDQANWLINGIKSNSSKWTLIGNQVIFSELDAGHLSKKNAKFMDTWNGYPAERKFLMDEFYKNGFSNILFLTGDIHTAWALDLVASPQNKKLYNRKTGSGVIGAEFVTPSISSTNLDERVWRPIAKMAGGLMKSKKRNPHLRYVNMVDHGYMLISLTNESALAQWFYCKSVKSPINKMRKKIPSYYLLHSRNVLKKR